MQTKLSSPKEFYLFNYYSLYSLFKDINILSNLYLISFFLFYILLLPNFFLFSSTNLSNYSYKTVRSLSTLSLFVRNISHSYFVDFLGINLCYLFAISLSINFSILLSFVSRNKIISVSNERSKRFLLA